MNLDVSKFRDNKVDLEFVRNFFTKNDIEAHLQHFNVTSPFQTDGQVSDNVCIIFKYKNFLNF